MNQQIQDHDENSGAARPSAAQQPPVLHRVFHKSYPRLPSLALPSVPPGVLDTLWERRMSVRQFEERPLPLESLAALLQACRIVTTTGGPERRTYPSGGGCFPLEIYVAAFNIAGLTPGVYHFDVVRHALGTLWQTDLRQYNADINSPFVSVPAASLMLTYIASRNQQKYGEHGLSLALLEAGHAAQNVLLAAADLGIGACPVYGFRHATISTLLDLTDAEQPLYVVAIGCERRHAAAPAGTDSGTPFKEHQCCSES